MNVALVSLHCFSEFKGGAERGVFDTYKLLNDAVNYKIITGSYHTKQHLP